MSTPPRPEPVASPLTFEASKPVYWLICIYDPTKREIYHSRMSDGKFTKAAPAYHSAYGRGVRFSGNVLFFNLTSTMTEARKIIRAVAFYQSTYHPPNPETN